MSCPALPILSPLKLVGIALEMVVVGAAAAQNPVEAPLVQLFAVTFVMTIGLYPGAETTPPEIKDTAGGGADDETADELT